MPTDKGFWKMRYIKKMRSVGGRREWLVAWSGQDEDGYGWEDSWRPTEDVTQVAIDEYFEEKKEKTKHRIEVDVAPTEEIVVRSIAQTAAAEKTATFGHVHEYFLHALSLADVAEHFASSVEKKIGVERIESRDDRRGPCSPRLCRTPYRTPSCRNPGLID
jgi:hypothetical protein